MKFVASLILAIALLFVTAAQAQNPPEIQSSAKVDSKDQVPPAPVIAPLSVGTAFNASLDDTLDTRKTKAGDAFTAQTVEDVSYESCIVFPKGTKIMGHIVRVTSSTRGHAGSAFFIQFDKAVMKDGGEVILNAGIQALTIGAVPPLPADGYPAKEAAPRAVPVQANEGSGASSSDPVIVSTIYEGPRTTIRPPRGSPLVPEGEFTAEGLFTLESKGAFGRPDVKVYTPTSEGSHGTVLLSAKKNIHLEAGTHLLLVVQPPPNGESDGVVEVVPNQ
jgi:hypothetical protein